MTIYFIISELITRITVSSIFCCLHCINCFYSSNEQWILYSALSLADMSAPKGTGRLGTVLPSGRVISTQVHYDVEAPHVRYSLMVMQWGQFLDHDITFTPMNTGESTHLLTVRQWNAKNTIFFALPRRNNRHCFL